MGSRLRTLRLDFRTTSTSSGTDWLRGATFLHRFGGSIFRRAIARQKPDHWGFRRSRTGLPRKSSSGTWSPSWNRSSMKAPMDIDPGRSAIDAVRKARQRCWRYDWVLDVDVRSYFDSIDWELLL